jgi:hypothetical protein
MTDTGGCWTGWGYLFRVSEDGPGAAQPENA